MNDKGLSCSTAILIIAVTFQGCSQLGTQITKVKSVMPGHEKPEEFLAAARGYEKKNELLAAREQYEKYLSRNPKSVLAAHRLGIVCSRLGDTIASTRYFTQARQLDPTNSELLNDFGFALYKRGEYKSAEKIFASALQNDANNKRIINNLALSIGHQGRFKESMHLFRNIMPAAEAHANLAYIHTQRGEGDLALKQYDLALTANPDLEQAGMAAAELAQMKNLSLARQAKKTDQQMATKKVVPKIQLTQSKPTSPTTKPARKKTIPVVREKLISQASMEKERVVPTRKATASQPEPEEDALEINSFRTLDEITQDEEPVIIRISNEVKPQEPMFRSPTELSSEKTN